MNNNDGFFFKIQVQGSQLPVSPLSVVAAMVAGTMTADRGLFCVLNSGFIISSRDDSCCALATSDLPVLRSVRQQISPNMSHMLVAQRKFLWESLTRCGIDVTEAA